MNPTALALLLLAASSATLAAPVGSDSGSSSGSDGLNFLPVFLAACAEDRLVTGIASASGFAPVDEQYFRILGEASPGCPFVENDEGGFLAEAPTDSTSGASDSSDEASTPGICSTLFNDPYGEVLGVFSRAGCASIRWTGYVDLATGVVTPHIMLPLYSASAVMDRRWRLLALTGSRGLDARTLYNVIDDYTATPICRIPQANGGQRLSFVNGEVYVSYQSNLGSSVLHLDVDASIDSGDATAACVGTEIPVFGIFETPSQVVQKDGVTLYMDRESYGLVAGSGLGDIPDTLTYTPLGDSPAGDGLALTDIPDGFNDVPGDDDSDSDDGTCGDLVPKTFYYLGRFITSRPTGTVGPFINGVQYYEVENADSYTPREDCAGL